MRFAELDLPIGRSDSQQASGVSSTPGPSNGNPHSIFDQLIDVALEVGESGSELLHPILVFLPSTNRMATVRKVRDKIFCQHGFACCKAVRVSKDFDESPGKHVSAFHQFGRSSRTHEPQGYVRTHTGWAEFHHQHRKRLDVPGIFQSACVDGLKAGIPDKFGGMAFCVAIVAAIEDCRHVAAEQMCSGMKHGRKYRIKYFNDCGAGDEPGYFFCGRSVMTYLKASGTKRIHATDERFPVHPAGGGECILYFSPWDCEKQHISKTHRIPRCARSSMRADLQHKIFQLLRSSRVT